jgi:phage terminase small subunit
MPRRSTASLTMMALAPRATRLRPPASLSEPARKVFIGIVSTSSSTHFAPSDLPLLTTYCEACALAERATAELSRAPVDKHSKALITFEKATRVMTALSLRLRLSPQSRTPTSAKPAPTTSYYEELRLENDDDQDARQ